MLHITKRFPGIIANDDITLRVKKGEIHALLGENGAGKSTLMSVRFGLYQPEEGEIRKNGKPVKSNDPNDATALGIGMVICGAIKLGGYFSKDLFRLAFQYDLAFGILLIAVGIITLCHPGEAMTFLCVMFGIPVLADGLFKIQVAVEAKRFGISQWWLVLLLAVLTGVIGLLLVLRPAEGARVMVMLMGASLLLDGALNLSVALCAVKVVDHQRPDVIETDDFEIE